MQSKYFSPVFNSAIFDGPIRIYFAQPHESLALKIYFLIQQNLKEEVQRLKDLTKDSGGNLLILIYPTSELYEQAFETLGSRPSFAGEVWNEDFVVGTRGPLEDTDLDPLMVFIQETTQDWSSLVGFGSPLRAISM